MWFCLKRKLVTCDLIAQVKICKVLKKKKLYSLIQMSWYENLITLEKISNNWSVLTMLVFRKIQCFGAMSFLAEI
jgi:hypothetical protein